MPEKKTRSIEEIKKEIGDVGHIDPGDWYTTTEYSFYAVIEGGKVAVPKEVMKELKLKEDSFVILTINVA